ncbi:biotin--[acetyl-CoA-carboxylase] ligase [Tichowtungia aerotolerans]|uniref:Biotin--[acetyl-CoA-carboxylase] ligase n=1 Tax=Tichowtungia aerotolerans TaxID=2697043 RepID=A0A6P1M737_9BACT|nr:biotin--[acetyl-CoA-carboxylase] ligase [Tichowtungia aerotolerans]QHI70400.1 biotin--[acetyl-CoA-carboxylase] ligase [Tichowtungia aerotolerans]
MKFCLRWYDRLPSTNTFLKELLEVDSQLPSGTVVATREQTHGRGRRGRSWLASANENLTFSFLLLGSCEPQKLPAAAMAAAVAVAELLTQEGISADLKWPNDVLVNGRKICGILSEGVPGGIIVGIGLNVNMQNAGHIDQPATSMLIESGSRHSLDELLEKLLPILSGRLDEWAQGGFSRVRKKWEAHVPNIGKMISVRDGDAFREGLLAGFGENGELLLQDQSGTVSPVWAGDVSS